MSRDRAQQLVSDAYSSYYSSYANNPEYKKNIDGWISTTLEFVSKIDKSNPAQENPENKAEEYILIDVVGAVTQPEIREVIYRDLNRDERQSLEQDIQRLRPGMKDNSNGLLGGNILAERYGDMIDQLRPGASGVGGEYFGNPLAGSGYGTNPGNGQLPTYGEGNGIKNPNATPGQIASGPQGAHHTDPMIRDAYRQAGISKNPLSNYGANGPGIYGHDNNPATGGTFSGAAQQELGLASQQVWFGAARPFTGSGGQRPSTGGGSSGRPDAGVSQGRPDAGVRTGGGSGSGGGVGGTTLAERQRNNQEIHQRYDTAVQGLRLTEEQFVRFAGRVEQNARDNVQAQEDRRVATGGSRFTEAERTQRLDMERQIEAARQADALRPERRNYPENERRREDNNYILTGERPRGGGSTHAGSGGGGEDIPGTSGGGGFDPGGGAYVPAGDGESGGGGNGPINPAAGAAAPVGDGENGGDGPINPAIAPVGDEHGVSRGGIIDPRAANGSAIWSENGQDRDGNNGGGFFNAIMNFFIGNSPNQQAPGGEKNSNE